MRKNNTLDFILASILWYTASAYVRGGAAGAGRDDWLCLGAGLLLALPAILTTAALSRSRPDKSLGETIRETLAPVPAAVLSGFYILYGLCILSFSLDAFSRYICICVLPETPKAAAALVIGLAVYLTSRGGAEGIRRLSGLIFPAIALTLLAVIGLSVPSMTLSHLAPVGRQITGRAVLRAAMFPYAEPVILLSLTPGCGRLKRRWWIIPFALSSALLIFICVRNTAVLGGALADFFTFPTVQADSVVGYSAIGQRVEVFTTLIPASAGFVEAALAARFSLDAAEGIGKGKESLLLPVIPAVSFLICVFVLRSDAVSQARDQVWPFVSLASPLPVLYLLARRRAKRSEKGKRFLRCLKKAMK